MTFTKWLLQWIGVKLYRAGTKPRHGGGRPGGVRELRRRLAIDPLERRTLLDNVAVPGGITGDYDLQKIDEGTLDLSGAIGNSSGFNGDLLVQGGFVGASDISNLGSLTNSALVFDGGELQATDNFTIAANLNKEIDVRSGGAIFDTNGYTLEIDAAIGKLYGSDTSAAAGGITAIDSSGTDSGVLILTAVNVFQGNVEIASGTADFNTPVSLPLTASILIESGGALEVDPAGPYPTATAWLQSGAIDPSSSGALALTGNSSEDIDMSGFPSLSLGAVVNVNYSGTITPYGNTYLLGGGPGTLTDSSAVTSQNVVVNGNVALGAANDSVDGLTVNGRLDLAGYSVATAALSG